MLAPLLTCWFLAGSAWGADPLDEPPVEMPIEGVEDEDEGVDTDLPPELPPEPPPPPTPAELCGQGEVAQCYSAGEAYFSGGDGVPKDQFRALQLFRKGCAGEDHRSCFAMAEAFTDGAGVTADAAQANEAYQKACEYGLGIACRQVGDQYVLVAANPRDAALWYGIGCELQDGPSCTATALAYERGDQDQSDPERARRHFLAACQYGSGRGCTLLGYRYSKGLEGAKRDDNVALALFRRGCEADDAEGCRFLAELHEQGRGGLPTTGTTVRQAYERACQLGDTVSCRWVGATNYAAGDYRKSMLAARRGCELGDTKSCKLAEKAEARRPR